MNDDDDHATNPLNVGPARRSNLADRILTMEWLPLVGRSAPGVATSRTLTLSGGRGSRSDFDELPELAGLATHEGHDGRTLLLLVGELVAELLDATTL